MALVSQSTRIRLYSSRVISQFLNRLFTFTQPLLFILIWTDTFFPTALLSFATYLTHFFVLPYIGVVLDSTDTRRRRSATQLILTKCLCNAGSLLALYGAYRVELNSQSVSTLQQGGLVGYAVSVLLSIVGECAEESWTIAFERTWLVLLTTSASRGATAEEDESSPTTTTATLSVAEQEAHQANQKKLAEEELTHLNVTVRRVDLLCLTVAPLLFGLLLQFVEVKQSQIVLGAIGISALFLVLMVPEMKCVWAVYDQSPSLWDRVTIENRSPKKKASSVSFAEAAEQPAQTPPPSAAATTKKPNVLEVLVGSWNKYVHHPVFLASFAYSLLYFTVLDGGSVMLSYLLWSGVPESLLGLMRGAGALLGLLGSAMFVPAKRCFGGSLERTGIASVWAFWLNLLPLGILGAGLILQHPGGIVGLLDPMLSTNVSESEQSSTKWFGLALLVVVASSRCMLWLFDLDHTMIMQLYVEDGERSEINGAQSALYRVFWLLLSIATMILSHPHQFPLLAMISIGSVLGSACLFTKWALQRHSAPATASRSKGDADDAEEGHSSTALSVQKEEERCALPMESPPHMDIELFLP